MNDDVFKFECVPACKVFSNNKIPFVVEVGNRRVRVADKYYYHPIKNNWRLIDSAYDWKGPDSPKKFLIKVGLCK